MRGLTGLAAVVCAAVVVPSLVGATNATPAQPYILQGGAGFEIHSNRDWHGTGHTTSVREAGKPYTGSTPRDTDRSYQIWTEKCSPGQKFSVARSVELLGKPSSASVNFTFAMYVASTTVLVNGHVAEKGVGNNVPSSMTPAQLGFFHEGQNELDVIVTMPNTANACPSGTTQASVWFQISGSFASDLKVLQPKQPTTYYKSGSAMNIPTKIGVANAGSDLIPEATFTVQLSTHGFCLAPNADGSCHFADYQFQFANEGAPSGTTCDLSNSTLIITCSLHELKPGETRYISLLMGFRADPANPSWTQEGVSLSWFARIAVPGPADTNSADDSSQANVVFCSTRATDAGCNNPTG